MTAIGQKYDGLTAAPPRHKRISMTLYQWRSWAPVGHVRKILRIQQCMKLCKFPFNYCRNVLALAYGAGIVESNWSIDPYRHAVAQRGPKHSCVLREMFYYGAAELPPLTQTNKKAVLPQGNRAMPQVFFSVEVRQQHSLQV